MNKIIEHNELGNITLRKMSQAKNYTIRLNGGKVWVTLPYDGSYKKALELVEEHKEQIVNKLQESKARTLPETDEPGLRKKAGAVLPGKLQELALKYEFKYTSVRITKSRTRWGSCSSKAAINLSFRLMLLPEHLIDYVLLHELCHTVHMNHGHGFWQLLNNVTNNCAYALRKELQTHRFA